jgi:hypothetical protein
MDSKFVRGQFVLVAGSPQEQEVATFKATANDVLYTVRDSAGVETKDVSQANITGLNKFNSDSWTGNATQSAVGRLVAKLCPA